MLDEVRIYQTARCYIPEDRSVKYASAQLELTQRYNIDVQNECELQGELPVRQQISIFFLAQ
jgi:hypothetical protein